MKRATKILKGIAKLIKISIHALVKRATAVIKPPLLITPYFNPRPREEGDMAHRAFLAYAHDFNPRPREEGDGIFGKRTPQTWYFNPRPREEGDDRANGYIYGLSLIHI